MKLWTLFAFALILCLSSASHACSRFTYTTQEGGVVIGRSMDWMEDMQTDLWAFPAGISRIGSDAPNSIKWTSKYGSVIASGYNLGTTDGINSRGLVANLLYLATTDYGQPSPDRQNLSVLNWAQYTLDNFSTVDEAVKGLSKNPLHIIAKPLPNGTYPGVHLSISDPSGDNAIFEYVDGNLDVYHGKQYTVMTNEPTYDKQLALNEYWQGLKGCFLPGTSEPPDRFIRASYYLGQAPSSADVQQSIAIVFSIIRNVSQPFMKNQSDRPNQSATLWRSVADAKHLVYYFEKTNRPNIVWVDLSKLNLNAGEPIKKLPLANGEIYAGEVSSHFMKSKSF